MILIECLLEVDMEAVNLQVVNLLVLRLEVLNLVVSDQVEGMTGAETVFIGLLRIVEM